MELKPHERVDEEGNIVGPGYMLSPDGDLLFFESPSAMGYGPKKKPETDSASGEASDGEQVRR